MATNTIGDVSYISIVSHLEDGNSSEFIVLHSPEVIVLYQTVCVCVDYYKLHTPLYFPINYKVIDP